MATTGKYNGQSFWAADRGMEKRERIRMSLETLARRDDLSLFEFDALHTIYREMFATRLPDRSAPVT